MYESAVMAPKSGVRPLQNGKPVRYAKEDHLNLDYSIPIYVAGFVDWTCLNNMAAQEFLSWLPDFRENMPGVV